MKNELNDFIFLILFAGGCCIAWITMRNISEKGNVKYNKILDPKDKNFLVIGIILFVIGFGLVIYSTV